MGFFEEERHTRMIETCRNHLRRFVAVSLLLAGCYSPPLTDFSPRVVRPTHVSAIELPATRHAVPTQLRGPRIFVATTTHGVALVGDRAGLFALESGGFRAISSFFVTGLDGVDSRTLVVSSTTSIHLYDGVLVESPLGEAFVDTTIRCLWVQDESLWIGTKRGLERFADTRLTRTADRDDIVNVAAFDGSRTIAVEDASGHHRLLRDGQSEQPTMQTLADEFSGDAVLPLRADRVVGLFGGALFERTAADPDNKTAEDVVWRPFALSDAEDAMGATNIDAIAVDPKSGAVWAADATHLHRIDVTPGRISRLVRPPGLNTIQSMRVTRDGALWLFDATSLVRVGNADPPVRFAPTIARFSEANCVRCHSPIGPGRRLDRVADWVEHVDAIVDAIERGTMPQDQRPLVEGTVDLVRRWRADGLLP